MQSYQSLITIYHQKSFKIEAHYSINMRARICHSNTETDKNLLMFYEPEGKNNVVHNSCLFQSIKMGLLFDSCNLEIISILVSLLCILLAYFKYSFGYWSRRGVPYIPAHFPFGNTKDMILQKLSLGESFLGIYKHFKSKGHRFGGFYILSKPQLILIDPELIKNILTKDFAYFSERGIKSNEDKEPLTGHLAALSGIKWKNMRQTLTPNFTSRKMKMMFQTLLECADGLEGIMDEYVKNKEDIDIKDVVGRFTTDIIGSCAFGLDCNSINDPDAEFHKFGTKVFNPSTRRIFKRIFLQVFPRIFHFLNLREIDKDISDFFMKVVADTIDYREKNNIKRNDFLQLLINIKNTGDVDATTGNANLNGKGLTLGEIAAHSFIFFLGGFETSSSAMSFFLYDMALHQDIQDKVRNEINDMLKKYDGKLTYDGIMELQYLEKAIHESMRLHPGIPMIQRRCVKDYKIPDSDIVIEKGIIVTIPIYGMQSDPEHYPEPTKFDPERFSNEEKAKRHPFTFLAFGKGPRICIGQRFGLMQTKVGLTVVLKNHRFTLNKKTQVPLKFDPTTFLFSVVGGIWLNAERI